MRRRLGRAITRYLRRRGWRHETDLAQIRLTIGAGMSGPEIMDIDLASLYHVVKWGGGFFDNLTNVRVAVRFEPRDG